MLNSIQRSLIFYKLIPSYPLREGVKMLQEQPYV